MKFKIITGNEFKTVQRKYNLLAKESESLEDSFITSLTKSNFEMFEHHALNGDGYADLLVKCDILIVEDNVDYILEYFDVFSNKKYNGGYENLNLVACTKEIALIQFLHNIDNPSSIKLVIVDIDLGENVNKNDNEYLSRLQSRIKTIRSVLLHKFKMYAITQYQDDSHLQNTMSWLRSVGIDTFSKSHYFDKTLNVDLDPTSDDFQQNIKINREKLLSLLGHKYKNALDYHSTLRQPTIKDLKKSISDNISPNKDKCEKNTKTDLTRAVDFIKRLNDGCEKIYKMENLDNVVVENIKDVFAQNVEQTKKSTGTYLNFRSISQEVSKQRYCIGYALDTKFHLELEDVKYFNWIIKKYGKVLFPHVKKSWDFSQFDQNELNSLSQNKYS